MIPLELSFDNRDALRNMLAPKANFEAKDVRLVQAKRPLIRSIAPTALLSHTLGGRMRLFLIFETVFPTRDGGFRYKGTLALIRHDGWGSLCMVRIELTLTPTQPTNV